jgi:hypothetical protein
MRRLFFLLFFFVSIQGIGQTKMVSEKIKISEACDKIMSAINRQDFDSVLILLKKHSVVDPIAIDSFKSKIISAISTSADEYGKFLGTAFILEKSAGEVASKRYYAIRFEHYFLKCKFSLYNNGISWVITGFSFDEEFSELF